MNRKLIRSCMITYTLFLLGSSLAALFLLPPLLRYTIEHFSGNPYSAELIEHYPFLLQWVSTVSVLFISIMSLIPFLYVYYKFYRPLTKVVRETHTLSQSREAELISYDQSDEIGYLASSINYLVQHVRDSESQQHKLISNISHDLRSPLTSIKGYVEAILDGTIPAEMQEKYLNVVLTETMRLQTLTDSLVSLDTISNGKISFNRTSFVLEPCILKIIDAVEGLCYKKNIKVLLFNAEPRLIVHEDISHLEQVLYNLLDNAIKFSNPESEIHITVTSVRQKVFISVKDFGEGIDADQLPYIWDRFYKTDPARGREKKGSGLGLSIVREIIRSHNQTIDVISTKDVGTEFIFTLNKK